MRLIIALALVASVPGIAVAAETPPSSWGKPGVGFEDYRLDTTFCLNQAEATNLVGTEPAEALVVASRRIDNALGQNMGSTASDPRAATGGGLDQSILAAGQVARAMEQARPELRIRQARSIMQERLDSCLELHGYSRFVLTEEQRRSLRGYGQGEERQRFLHRLASDPAVLAAQAVQAPPAE
jgi:hypothetical protein